MSWDEDSREFVRDLFAKGREGQAPADVVPHKRLTPTEKRAMLLVQNETSGTWAEITTPGEVILDVDGVPVGVGAATTGTVHRSTIVTPAELEAVGLTPEDVPNLTIHTPRGESRP